MHDHNAWKITLNWNASDKKLLLSRDFEHGNIVWPNHVAHWFLNI